MATLAPTSDQRSVSYGPPPGGFCFIKHFIAWWIYVIALGPAMKDRQLEKMDLDDLWDLHQRIIAVLDRKLETEKRRLQDQLDELGRKFGGSPKDIPQRRPYPKVEPKFRNPNDPSETWSGRGKTPRWMTEMIADGRSVDEFRIQ